MFTIKEVTRYQCVAKKQASSKLKASITNLHFSESYILLTMMYHKALQSASIIGEMEEKWRTIINRFVCNS